MGHIKRDKRQFTNKPMANTNWDLVDLRGTKVNDLRQLRALCLKSQHMHARQANRSHWHNIRAKRDREWIRQIERELHRRGATP